MAGRIAGFLLDLLFPQRCPWCSRVIGFADSCVCGEEIERIKCADEVLNKNEFLADNLQGLYAVLRYEQPVRSSLHRLKFDGERSLAAPLGKAMAEKLQKLKFADQLDLVIPVPVSARALKQRGYNQSALLAMALAETANLAYCGEVLKKVRETPPQRTLTREQRLNNLAGAYQTENGVAGKRVLLVDDVVTTGSTLNECAASLLHAGAVDCWALCLTASFREVSY